MAILHNQAQTLLLGKGEEQFVESKYPYELNSSAFRKSIKWTEMHIHAQSKAKCAANMLPHSA